MVRIGMVKDNVTSKPRICFVDDHEADSFISTDALALLIGMVLDQQQTIEKAFRGPLELVRRMGREPVPGELDAAEIAAMPAEELKALFSIVPALHRFPASNAARTQELCAHIVNEYGGEPSALWLTAETGAALLKRMKKVPGFGERKARIFVALVGKRLGIELEGWREAAGEFGEANVLRSVADIEGPETKAAYRELKKVAKDATDQDSAGQGKADAETRQGQPARLSRTAKASERQGKTLSKSKPGSPPKRPKLAQAPEPTDPKKSKTSTATKQKSSQAGETEGPGTPKPTRATKTVKSPSAKKKG